jgi:hypothetical protein
MSKQIVPRNSAHKTASFAVMLALSILAYPAAAMPASGGDVVQGLYDVLLDTMKNGRTLGQGGRFVEL